MTTNMIKGVISELVVYPVKSLQGISLTKSEVTEQGLKWDRHWMIVNEDGLFLTQRNNAQLATIRVSLNELYLELHHPEHQSLQIPLFSKPNTQKKATVWKSECTVLDEGQLASDWLVAVLGLWRGQTLRLVKMAPNFKRQVSVKHTGGVQNSTNFADAYPFLITNSQSLNELNNKLLAQQLPPIPMNRFRGNIVIDTNEAFVEHNAKQLRINDLRDNTTLLISFCNPCERCKVPGIDQTTAEIPTPQQPLKTLMAMEHVPEKGAYFGQNAVLANREKQMLNRIIYVGDSVEFL